VALRITLASADGQVAPAALAPTQAAIARYAIEHARVLGPGGGACRGQALGVSPKAEHVLVSVRWSCAPSAGTLRYHVTLFHEIDPAAKHMVTVSGDARRMGLLSAANPRLDLLETRASGWEVARHYVLAGIEHIMIGYDHIAFLVAVILWGRRPWPLVGVVTAFTVAHSITLSAAVLELVSPPPRLVEIMIALSIVYVAAENFFVHDVRRRWKVTFVFGLVHGFGFAGVLREYGLPSDALAPALAAFNAGVEVGQVAIVLLAVAILRALEALARARARGPVVFPDARFVHAVSWAILALGLYWTAERALG
jgi:hydrogenase/urease accessory protein HupE